MKLKTVINGESLYQLYFNDCMYYISTNELYLKIIIDGKMHIFNTSQNSDEIPENLIQSLQFMNDANFNMSFLTTARIKLNKANVSEISNKAKKNSSYTSRILRLLLDRGLVRVKKERINRIYQASLDAKICYGN